MASVKAHFPVKTEAAAPVGKGKAAASGAQPHCAVHSLQSASQNCRAGPSCRG
jgi:hypothetical protein